MTNDPSGGGPPAPDGRPPLGDTRFRFLCDASVECFNRCCHDPDLELYPYDVVRLSARLGLSSREFLEKHTYHSNRSNPYFPSVMLRMTPAPGRPCPFLTPGGCSVYEDRPDACRMFPLERGVSVQPFRPAGRREVYYLQKVPYCRGHGRDAEWNAAEWVEAQGLSEYNRMGDLWAELSLLFRRNPWGPAGYESPVFRMAYTALFDVDNFRDFVFGSSFLRRYRVREDWLERIRHGNAELLEFAFEWLKYMMFRARPEKFEPVSG